LVLPSDLDSNLGTLCRVHHSAPQQNQKFFAAFFQKSSSCL
jgi:hypothetical protein